MAYFKVCFGDQASKSKGILNSCHPTRKNYEIIIAFRPAFASIKILEILEPEKFNMQEMQFSHYAE